MRCVRRVRCGRCCGGAGGEAGRTQRLFPLPWPELSACGVLDGIAWKPCLNSKLPQQILTRFSVLRALPEPRRRRGIRIPAWTLLLVATLSLLSRCQSLRDSSAPPDAEGFSYAIGHHTARTSALEIELTRPPSDPAFRRAATPNFMRTPIALEGVARGSWDVSEQQRW
jgi:hypothetical protein